MRRLRYDAGLSRRSLIWGLALAGIAVTYGGIWFADFYVPPGSEEQLQRAVADNPADSASRIALAELLSARKAYPQASLVLHEGLKVSPHEPELYRAKIRNYLAWAEEHDDKLENAYKYFQLMANAGYATVDDYLAMAKTQIAKKRYFRAAKSYEQAYTLAPERKELRERQYDCLMYAGKYEEAQAFFRKRTVIEPGNARAWMLFGISQYLLGDYDGSVAALTKAAGLEFTDGESRKRCEESLAYAKKLQAKRQGNREDSELHFCLGNFHNDADREDRKAAEYALSLELGATDLCHESWALRGVARFCQSLGQYDKALESLERAVERDTRYEAYDDLSYTYQSLLGLYESLASKEEKGSAAANELYEKAFQAARMELETCRKAGNGHMEIHAVADLADLLRKYHGIGDERTQQARSDMLKFLPNENDALNCATHSVVETEARMLHDEKDDAGASELLLRCAAWNPASQTGVYSYTFLSFLAHEQGDFDKGIEYGKQAITCANHVRASQGADIFRQQIGAQSRAEAFQALARNAVKAGKPHVLFNCSELYKAQALLEVLASKTAESELPKQLVVAKAEPNPALLNPPETEDAVAGSTTRNLNIEGTGYPRLPEDTSVANRQIPSFRSMPAVRLEEAQSLLGNATLISYGVGDEHSVAVVVDKNSAFSCELAGVTEPVLRGHIEKLRQGLGIQDGTQRDLAVEPATAAPSSADARAAMVREASEALYSLLIAPLREHVQSSLVCISADGILNFLPFELLSKDGRCLIEDYAVAYTPSATVLKYCMGKERHKRESILALGNPNLQNPAFRLLNAQDEVESLREFFRRAEVCTGADASEAVVRETAGQYDILHFACHGELNADQPMLTSLRLSPSGQDDGYLHAGEVFDLELSASLVVLSACNSGLGKLHSGNELMGLTRSFLYAGTPAIIASLWTVDDRSTAYLMRHFYRNLSQMTKAEALRQAKLATMKEFPGPFHWAAFCLQGDYR